MLIRVILNNNKAWKAFEDNFHWICDRLKILYAKQWNKRMKGLELKIAVSVKKGSS